MVLRMTPRQIATNKAAVVCDVCGRTLLRGEEASVFLAGGARPDLLALGLADPTFALSAAGAQLAHVAAAAVVQVRLGLLAAQQRPAAHGALDLHVVSADLPGRHAAREGSSGRWPDARGHSAISGGI